MNAARKLFKQALKQDRTSNMLYGSWGTAECNADHISNCEKVYKAGLKVCPSNLRTHFVQHFSLQLGQAYRRQSQYDKAASLL